MDKIKLSNAIVNALGGPTAVARIVHLNRRAVSYWSRRGIPDNRLQQLRDLFPKVVRRVEDEISSSSDQA